MFKNYGRNERLGLLNLSRIHALKNFCNYLHERER